MARYKKTKMNAIDFFCGTGGVTCGFNQAGIKVLAGIDIDSTCLETYHANNKKSLPIKEDIHNLKPEDLEEKTGIKKNDDALIFICCSPCQYWSKINTSKKKSELTKDLLKEFRRFVSYFKPGYILIENVPGLYKKRNSNILGDFLEFLKDESYHYDDNIINASLYGVPQNRERYILIATRVSNEIRIPEKEFNNNLTVKNSIGDYTIYYKILDGHKDKTDFIHTSARLSGKNKKRIKITPIDGGTRLSWKNISDLQLDAYKHNDKIFKDVYGRMFWDKPAPTITTRFNSLSNGRFGHPEQPRAISLREGATLQSFPIDYVFKGTSESSIARQIGNAVPPELARRMGDAIIKNYESKQSLH